MAKIEADVVKNIQSDKYKDWDILQEMPEGWKIDKTVGSPVFDCVFITNGKSVIN